MPALNNWPDCWHTTMLFSLFDFCAVRLPKKIAVNSLYSDIFIQHLFEQKIKFKLALYMRENTAVFYSVLTVPLL